MTVEIVGTNGEVVGHGREGRVRLSGEAAVKGYVNDPETTRAKFDAHGFYPGDLGHITPSGILVLRGREAGVMNISGEKVTAERIEAAVASFPGSATRPCGSRPRAVSMNSPAPSSGAARRTWKP